MSHWTPRWATRTTRDWWGTMCRRSLPRPRQARKRKLPGLSRKPRRRRKPTPHSQTEASEVPKTEEVATPETAAPVTPHDPGHSRPHQTPGVDTIAAIKSAFKSKKTKAAEKAAAVAAASEDKRRPW